LKKRFVYMNTFKTKTAKGFKILIV
jgi:hypothetical protein